MHEHFAVVHNRLPHCIEAHVLSRVLAILQETSYWWDGDAIYLVKSSRPEIIWKRRQSSICVGLVTPNGCQTTNNENNIEGETRERLKTSLQFTDTIVVYS